MRISYEKPTPPNVTVTLTPEEFILLGVVMGSICGSITNSIRGDDLDGRFFDAVTEYINRHHLNVDLKVLSDSLVSSPLVVADGKQWSLK